MSELRELYQEVILDHGRTPRNRGKLADADGRAEGYNPLCGDRLTVYVKHDGGRIGRIAFEGSGCAISMASASMMTEAVAGASPAEIEQRFEDFHALVTGKLDPDAAPARLGKLAVFAGVREFPVRVKCATLPWHTLRAALAHDESAVSTE
jgi:nitrogen fixation NifU-like protein